MRRILVLGGTAEASALAGALAARGEDAVLSLAGRTASPRAQALPVRVGGFGGAEGLAAYLAREGVTHLVDATHPFAARISRNAVAAAEAAGVPLVALVRPEWRAGPGDRWTEVPDMAGAVAALADMAPRRVFLAIGRQEAGLFAGAGAHRWLLRVVDPPEGEILPGAEVVVARGPFTAGGDAALMREGGVEVVVAKNAGGEGARAKLDAARALGLPVVMVARPALPARREVRSVEDVLHWLEAERGV